MAIVNMEAFVKGQFGTFTINDTSAATGNWHALKVESDAVFSNLEINDVVDNVRDSYISTPGGTIPKGTLICAGEPNVFTKVQLTSGCVTGLKAQE